MTCASSFALRARTPTRSPIRSTSASALGARSARNFRTREPIAGPTGLRRAGARKRSLSSSATTSSSAMGNGRRSWKFVWTRQTLWRPPSSASSPYSGRPASWNALRSRQTVRMLQPSSRAPSATVNPPGRLTRLSRRHWRTKWSPRMMAYFHHDDRAGQPQCARGGASGRPTARPCRRHTARRRTRSTPQPHRKDARPDEVRRREGLARVLPARGAGANPYELVKDLLGRAGSGRGDLLDGVKVSSPSPSSFSTFSIPTQLRPGIVSRASVFSTAYAGVVGRGERI